MTILYFRYLSAFQHFINSLLKGQGYPKTTLFDINRPTETITAAVNYFAKHSLNYKLNAKQYVKPAVEYVQVSIEISNNFHKLRNRFKCY